MAFLFSFAWSLFLVFEKITDRTPWPLRIFLLGQFPDEFAAQKAVVRARLEYC
ncbi:MAG TPA: hypothetical protein VFV92_00365 [Candidatus Bathyarchaeia archaeon]|nr:hypothetical protein [Candidatus Bathyarchaeia archaeon]